MEDDMRETQAELRENHLDYLDACWRSGYRAYEVGRAKKGCPLAKGSEARKSWDQGWDRAKREYEPDYD